jgi:hypothetical protein
MNPLALLGLLLLAVSPAVQAAETAASAQAAKRPLISFVKEERVKRWAFEDKLLQQQRAFEDEVRKARHDAQLEDEAMLEGAADIKSARKAISEKHKERQKLWQKKIADHRKTMGDQRKAFAAQLTADRKAFRDAHPASAVGMNVNAGTGMKKNTKPGQ